MADQRRDRIRSFLLGGVVGISAAAATTRRRRRLDRRQRKRRRHPPGLAAFEDAPCYREFDDGEDDSRS